MNFTCFFGLEGLRHSGSPNFPNLRLRSRRTESYRWRRLGEAMSVKSWVLNCDHSLLFLSARSQKRGKGGSFGSVALPGGPSVQTSAVRLLFDERACARNLLWGATFLPCTCLSIYPTQPAWKLDQTQSAFLAKESACAAERELHSTIYGTSGACFLKKNTHVVSKIGATS